MNWLFAVTQTSVRHQPWVAAVTFRVSPTRTVAVPPLFQTPLPETVPAVEALPSGGKYVTLVLPSISKLCMVMAPGVSYS